MYNLSGQASTSSNIGFQIKQLTVTVAKGFQYLGTTITSGFKSLISQLHALETTIGTGFSLLSLTLVMLVLAIAVIFGLYMFVKIKHEMDLMELLARVIDKSTDRIVNAIRELGYSKHSPTEKEEEIELVEETQEEKQETKKETVTTEQHVETEKKEEKETISTGQVEASTPRMEKESSQETEKKERKRKLFSLPRRDKGKIIKKVEGKEEGKELPSASELLDFDLEEESEEEKGS